jgi:hypothetical protein
VEYICIKCRRTWSEGKDAEGPSGGLCDQCITEYIRKKQRKEGHKDCFRRATEECSEDCKYKTECLKYINRTAI